ncbi:coiled-coil and C2 domain-containing protein 2A [Nymphalis io]|uniref:coiled-coil and C2 domain-containing protein 2A n=1 Tax=Inachis io TaxID=171585 RepID=UPI00216A9370|nr:coiled-coil and C2 domain-containing protein 2A [Nymphalis io]
MTEDIESICIHNDSVKSGSEEYYEISQELMEETILSSKSLVPPIKEYDFFVQYDTGKKKKVAKKKKRKKQEKSRKLMDILNTELSAKPLVIKSNIIKLDYKRKQKIYLAKDLYLSKTSELKESRNIAIENGLIRRKSISISPIFPRVLEATIRNNKTIHAQYMEPSLFSDVLTEYLETETKQNPKFLDVILRNIKFKHHHQFSLESFLCTQLLGLYNEYGLIKKSLKELEKNIEVNRRTRNSLKERLIEISPNGKDDIRFDKSLLKYTKLMLEFKEKYNNALKKQKEITHMLLSLWSDIETIRDKSKCVNTDCKLEVLRIEMDDSEFQNKWSKAFEIEYSDLIIQIEYDFVIKYLKYREFKQDISSENTKVRSKALKPKLSIDYDELKVQVEEIVNNIMPRNKIEILLKKDKTILTQPDVKGKSALLDNTYYFKVYVDDVFVCESDQYVNENSQFDIDFIESLSIEILPHNSYLKIILFENDEDVSFFKIKLFDCEVNIKLGWNEKLNDNQRESIKSLMRIGSQLKRFMHNINKPNMRELTEIINYLYENNVEKDENIMNALTDICKATVKKHEKFIINENSPEFSRFKLLLLRSNGGFVNIEDKTIPLFTSQISTEQLARLENNEEKDYRHFKRDTEMDAIDLQRYIGMKFVEKLNKNLTDNLSQFLMKKTFKDVVRDFGDLSIRSIFFNQADLSLVATSNITKQKLLRECLVQEQEIRIHVLRAFNLTDRSPTLLSEELNDNDDIAGFKVRALRPFVRISYRGMSAQTSTAIGCHPTWNYTVKLKAKFEPLSCININIYDECKDNVTEMYSDDQSTQSTVHYRKTNKWLGAISVPLHAVLNLGTICGTFKINTPPLAFGYDSTSSKEEQPFVPEVMQLMKQDTSLLAIQITTTLSHLGGCQTYCQPVPTHPQDDFIIKQVNRFVTDYVNEYPTRNISLTFIDSGGRNKCVAQFLQSVPIPEYEPPLDPKKSESALSKSSGHSKSSSSKSSGFEASKSEGNDLVKSIDAVVRYVSLIPTYDVNETESHVVTLMGVELLKVLYGSPLDHTILLASYFINLGIKCWVIIGVGLPRGQSSYVLIKYFKNKVLTVNDQIKTDGIFKKTDGYIWYIYDAVSGERFELREIGCPLKTVSYVFDSENIWVNTQASQDCESMSFDFSISSDWQTVFNTPLFITRPITDSLYTKPGDVENLRLNLESKIKRKVQKWRSHIKTIWNRYCSSLLKEMLPYYEYWAFNPLESRPTLGNRLKQLTATYKIFGFPLNMPYINTKLIISSIKSTSIHVNDDPNVEFGLGVEVYAYPNNVLSAWVFLACISRI